MYEKDNELRKVISDLIKSNGPIQLSEFMSICLYDRNYGYYANNKVIGDKGDFITSPEISQVFGEFIALSVFNNAKKSKFNKINLLELGPGKGTLTNDILITIDKIKNSGFELNPFLYEKNARLKDIQEKKLFKYKCKWVKNFNEISRDPTYIIANEFFDALPINQIESNNGFWYERKIGLKDNSFYFELGSKKIDAVKTNPYPSGKIIEDRLYTRNLLVNIFDLIIKNKGALIIIDYGQLEENLINGNTLQGVKKHKASNVFQNIGLTDLSSWVNFSDFTKDLPKEIRYQGPITQKEFLINLGIKSRFENLAKNKSATERRLLFTQFERLVSSSHMGQAFKVMILYSKNMKSFEGFK